MEECSIKFGYVLADIEICAFYERNFRSVKLTVPPSFSVTSPMKYVLICLQTSILLHWRKHKLLSYLTLRWLNTQYSESIKKLAQFRLDSRKENLNSDLYNLCLLTLKFDWIKLILHWSLWLIYKIRSWRLEKIIFSSWSCALSYLWITDAIWLRFIKLSYFFQFNRCNYFPVKSLCYWITNSGFILFENCISRISARF